MSCAITITAVSLNSSTGDITVQGSFSTTQSCATPAISIKVTCGSNSYGGSGSVISGSTVWQGTFPAGCSCDSPVLITVVAHCPGVPPVSPFSCSASFTTNNLCCCPQINTQVSLGACTGNNQIATFYTSIVNNTACTFTIRRAFGDGFFGNVFTILPYTSQNLTPELHTFAGPASYTSTVDVLSPPPLAACAGLDPVAFSISCTGCYSSPLIAALCRFLEWLFLFSIAAGLSIGFSQPCLPLAATAAFVAAGFLALFIYLLLQCNKCVCDFWLKYWGQILVSVGFVNLMFIPPGCSAITGFAAFINALIFLTLGFAILLLWYNNNKTTCPLTICDLWCAICGIQNIRSATNIAILIIILIWALTFPALSAGLGVALLVIFVFALFIWNNGPLSQPPCQHTPTCQ